MNPSPPPATFYDAATYQPEQSVGWLLRRVVNSLVSHIDARLAGEDLTHAQWVPLYKLWRGEVRTVAELARDLQVDPAAMTRSVDRLEAKGLLRRERSAQDRRVVELLLTDTGALAAAAMPAVLSDVINAHLAGFSHDEWQLLMQLLERMLSNGQTLRLQVLPSPPTP